MTATRFPVPTLISAILRSGCTQLLLEVRSYLLLGCCQCLSTCHLGHVVGYVPLAFILHISH